MKLRTHFIITKIAAEYCDASFWQKTIFCIGSLIPDLSPMQFIYRHFYSCSGNYVFRKLEELSGKTSPYAILTYGKMAHYLSDFCCSVHSGNGVGNIREHILYERQLNRYAVENYEQLKTECSGYQEVSDIIDNYFHSKKYNFHNDMIFSIKACISVYEKAFCLKKAPSYKKWSIKQEEI